MPCRKDRESGAAIWDADLQGCFQKERVVKIFHGHATTIGFAFALLIIVGIGAYSYRCTQGLIKTANRVSQIREGIDKLDDLLAQVLEVESAGRGFLVAGEDLYLEPFVAAIPKALQTDNELQSLLGANPAAQGRIRHLSNLVSEEIAHGRLLVDRRRAQGGPEAARQILISGRGYVLMDEIRNEVTAIRQEALKILNKEEQLARIDAERSMLALIVGSFLSTAMLALIFRNLSREISKRQRTEDRLRLQAQIVDQVHDSVISTDLDGKVTSWNEGAVRLTGYSSDEAMGRHISFLYPEEERHFLQHGVIQPLKARGNHETEVRMRKKTGEDFYAHLSLSLLYNKEGKVSGMIGYSMDITERRRKDDKIRQLNQDLERRIAERTSELAEVNKELEARTLEAERANRMKSEFLARMSHDLRTPLNAIIGFSDLLAECLAAEPREKPKRFLGYIQDGAHHLLQLINDILDVSKIEAGHVELNLESFAAIHALDEVLSIIHPLVTMKNMRIESNIPPGLTLWADPVRFRQILYNLLSNAVKFTAENGHIWIDSSQDNAFRYLSIRDSGIGIAREEQEAIFEEFHQVGSVRAEGTGLGLAITRKLVALHGGRIWVESEPGQGSRFIVALPIAPLPQGSTLESLPAGASDDL
jgi:PAS domain S-box-containing protein